MLSAEDTTLELNDVLNPDGVLRLNGTNLLFDRKDSDCGCLIEGTRSGETAQTQFASVSNTEVLLVPHIPTQDDPWNNEYTVSIHTAIPKTALYVPVLTATDCARPWC
ncbi:MAG: DUF4469 domain-containing protein [Candidatus Electrothrix sp. GW3-4]|uniref:DUF4469 domain-containing protein n=1 Tax=Candidatus Electrothrix sp. GW3-4 TaxID=3126740 RepID=UPI0030CFD962